jgi:aspartyl-tRNA synthetase
MPKGGIEAIEKEELENILAYQFDFVCNGCEMSSGALRNYDLDCLKLVFSKVGYDEDVVEKRFSSLYNAFQYGVPPHGGMAPGIDRIIMLLNDVDNLREVQAFPTSASGQDNLMGSPSEITEEQLRELHIKLR